MLSQTQSDQARTGGSQHGLEPGMNCQFFQNGLDMSAHSRRSHEKLAGNLLGTLTFSQKSKHILLATCQRGLPTGNIKLIICRIGLEAAGLLGPQSKKVKDNHFAIRIFQAKRGTLNFNMISVGCVDIHSETPRRLCFTQVPYYKTIVSAHRIAEGILAANNLVARFAQYVLMRVAERGFCRRVPRNDHAVAVDYEGRIRRAGETFSEIRQTEMHVLLN